MRRIGDCTRRRRFDPLRGPWYAAFRNYRFSCLLLGTPRNDPLVVCRALAAGASARPNS
jgi:hypothetical protein